MPTSVLYERTLERKRYLEANGYKVVFMWECEYKNLPRTDEDLKEFLQTYNQKFKFFSF